jgi:calcium-dependent protein kinase
MSQQSQPVEARVRIQAFSEQAFQLVDVEGSRFVDFQQAKTGLLFVFQQMKGELPQPYEYWYELVFRNFDRDRDGLIHFNDFVEIVAQYYDHYQRRQAKLKAESESEEQFSRASSSEPRPSSSQPAAAGIPAVMQNYATSQKSRPTRESGEQSAGPSAVNSPSEKNRVELPEINDKLAIFDDYEFFDKAGQGSFGKVMVVRHKVTKQVRACKAITIRGGQSQADLIRNETQLLRSLDHPNILKLFEVYYDGTNIYMISELCEGGSLLDRLNQHYPPSQKNSPHRLMSEGLVALIMQQLLAAVACCHSQQIIHRDAKPDNILFVNRSRESPLKLIDFGLATTLDSALKTAKEIQIKRKGVVGFLGKMLPGCAPQYMKRKIMTRAGTLHYFSPEMIRGEYTELTDLFSVGIIMYQLLTGIHPFYQPGQDDEQSVKFKISKRDVEFPVSFWSHISTDAKDLTRALLQRDPRDRITAAEAMKHRWFKDPLKPTLHVNGGGMVTQSIFEGLKEFKKSTKLKQVFLRLMARELTEIQTTDLRKKFQSLDKTGTGRIARADLVGAMKSIGLSTADVDELIPSEQFISYNQFLAALSERKVKYGKHQMREAFKKIETPNVGFVKISQIVDLVKTSLGKDANVEEVLKEAGLSLEDEGLTFDGFCDIVSFGFGAGAAGSASGTPGPSVESSR